MNWGPENIWLVSFGGVLALICNVLYMIGGTDLGNGGQKWLRRYLGSFILALGANITALVIGHWVWQYLLMFPCLAIGFSLPYGANTNWEKAFKRFIFALGVLLACVVGLYATGFTLMGWIVLGLAFATGLGSIVLGVVNPFNSATVEQFLICQILTLYVPFWAFVK